MIKCDKGKVTICGTGLELQAELVTLFNCLEDEFGKEFSNRFIKEALEISNKKEYNKYNKIDNKDLDKLMKELERIIKKF